VAFFHADACGIEIGFVTQHGEQNAAEPMGHRNDGGFPSVVLNTGCFGTPTRLPGASANRRRSVTCASWQF